MTDKVTHFCTVLLRLPLTADAKGLHWEEVMSKMDGWMDMRRLGTTVTLQETSPV